MESCSGRRRKQEENPLVFSSIIFDERSWREKKCVHIWYPPLGGRQQAAVNEMYVAHFPLNPGSLFPMRVSLNMNLFRKHCHFSLNHRKWMKSRRKEKREEMVLASWEFRLYLYVILVSSWEVVNSLQDENLSLLSSPIDSSAESGWEKQSIAIKQPWSERFQDLRQLLV